MLLFNGDKNFIKPTKQFSGEETKIGVSFIITWDGNSLFHFSAVNDVDFFN